MRGWVHARQCVRACVCVRASPHDGSNMLEDSPHDVTHNSSHSHHQQILHNVQHFVSKTENSLAIVCTKISFRDTSVMFGTGCKRRSALAYNHKDETHESVRLRLSSKIKDCNLDVKENCALSHIWSVDFS